MDLNGAIRRLVSEVFFTEYSNMTQLLEQIFSVARTLGMFRNIPFTFVPHQWVEYRPHSYRLVLLVINNTSYHIIAVLFLPNCSPEKRSTYMIDVCIDRWAMYAMYVMHESNIQSVTCAPVGIGIPQ